MDSRSEPAAGSDTDRTLVLTRSFDAPPEALFQAWIDPAQIARWIGPRSIKAEVEQMDARPGGSYRIAMHSASGSVNIVQGIYREMVAPERLVFTWAWEKDCAAGEASQGTVVTITFRAVGGKTEMTLRHERFETKEARDSHDHGWTGSFDKLAEVLAGQPGRR